MNTSVNKPKYTGWGLLLNRYVLALFVVAALASGGYFFWKKAYGREAELSRYQIVSVQRGDIEDLVTATGALQPREYVDVGAQVSGQLEKIHVEIGSVVKQGDLLAEIDPTVFRANVDARRAQLRNQRATLMDRESQLTLAQLQHTRQKNLMAGDATTAEALQSAEASVRSAKAQVDALHAQIDQTESTLRADEANLNYAKIYAPIAGVVVSITARQGQTLNANQQAPTILRIADLSTMTVQTQVSEADVSQLRPNMEVYFTTLGSRGKRWYGNLRKVEPTSVSTNNVVLYNALFDVPNEQRTLLPQMTAQVFFVSATAKDALTVPASAVTIQRNGGGERRVRAKENKTEGKAEEGKPRRENNGGSGERSERAAETPAAESGPSVWAGVSARRQQGPREGVVKVINAEGKIEERKVQVGISNRVQVQILSGLSEGEQVIAGVKPPPGAERERAPGQQRNALQTQGQPQMGGGRQR